MSFPHRDVHRRTLGILFVTQVLGGVGTAIGASVGALLATPMVGVAASGLAQSAAVVGGALLAVPATRILQRNGRRASLAAAYAVAALGAAIVVAAALHESVALLFLGLFLFGGGSTAGYQARYAAVDLAPEAARGRHLSLVVWATTLGAVAGPNLVPVAGSALAPFGIPPLAAPFALALATFAAIALGIFLFLRPDPFLTARAARAAHDPPERARLRDAIGVVAALPDAQLGIAAAAIGHGVMVGVMSMTPVHVGASHDTADTLRIVGVVISVHIAGMYAFAPVMGWLTDRLGRRAVVLGGAALLAAACAIAGTAGADSVRLAAGLALLGLGWSATMVAGSTLVAESVPREARAAAQGLADVVMGLTGATAGALSGVVVQLGGFSILAALGGAATVPLAVLALRPRPLARPGPAT